ncbi:MAG: hypothetical protein ACI8P0_004432 [Planctomycetaceae bacterium]
MVFVRRTADGCSTKVDPEQFVESFREEMESHLQAVMQAVNDAPDGDWVAGQQSGSIPTSFQATDCRADPTAPASGSRIYTGVDGVMVPAITDSEKRKRREAIKLKRQRSGKKCRPLPPRRPGTDESFKEFKVITFYSETGDHWYECLTRSRWSGVGPLVRREAKRLNFAAAADEKIANVASRQIDQRSPADSQSVNGSPRSIAAGRPGPGLLPPGGERAKIPPHRVRR